MNRAKPNRYNFTEEVLCLNCYRTGHHRHSCPYQGIVACSICFMTNVFTQNCNCKFPQKPKPRQTLRFVEDHLMVVDVEIQGREFEALINPSSKVTKIGNIVLNWLYERGYSSKEQHPSHLTIPIVTHGKPIELTCKVQRFLENSLELGTDFLARQGFKFQLGNIQLDSKRSPVMKSSDQYEHLYNMEPWGDSLRQYLERKNQNHQSYNRKRKTDDKGNHTTYTKTKCTSKSKSPRSLRSVVVQDKKKEEGLLPKVRPNNLS